MENTIAHSVRVQNTREDYPQIRSILYKNASLGVYYTYIALMVLSAFLFSGGMDLLPRSQLVPEFIANSDTIRFVLWLCFYFLLANIVARIFWPKREYFEPNGDFLRPHSIAIDEKGFSSRSEVKELFLTWKGVTKVEKAKNYILIYADRFSAYCLPVRSFESPQKAEEFFEAAQSYWRAAHLTDQYHINLPTSSES